MQLPNKHRLRIVGCLTLAVNGSHTMRWMLDISCEYI